MAGPEQMELASRSMDMFADDPHCAFFREARGSRATDPLELPWLDVEQAVLIAVNRNPGDDVASALAAYLRACSTLPSRGSGEQPTRVSWASTSSWA